MNSYFSPCLFQIWTEIRYKLAFIFSQEIEAAHPKKKKRMDTRCHSLALACFTLSDDFMQYKHKKFCTLICLFNLYNIFWLLIYICFISSVTVAETAGTTGSRTSRPDMCCVNIHVKCGHVCTCQHMSGGPRALAYKSGLKGVYYQFFPPTRRSKAKPLNAKLSGDI